jgi:DNA-binding winged helix-turn-helix (wHTH) protein
VTVRFRFGDCTLDLDTRELSRDGKPVHIEPKAFRLLELLVAARPKALSKDALQDQLWPNTFVSERSLARLVEVLRDCLGDSAKKPLFIRTVHGFGYAFSGEVEAAPRQAAQFVESEFHCRIVWGDREIALGEGENILGRDPAAAVWIDLNSVSRRHARILVANGSAAIEDLGSRNGTRVGGERVEKPRKLANGDTIKIGAAKLVFRCFRGLGSTQSEASSEIR